MSLDPASNSIEFELRHSTTAFANALRRVMIAEVPTFAFEHLEFAQNTSPLPDEFIAHRIGLCPLVCGEEAREFNHKDECTCGGGCPRCTINYIINVKNRDPHRPRTVTTDDLEYWYDEDDEPEFGEWIEKAKAIKPVRPSIYPGGDTNPITIAKLGPGQILRIICRAQKSTGREHAKWSPCCCSAYHMEPKIKLDDKYFKDLSQEKKRMFVESCPKNCYRYDQTADTVVVDKDRLGECTFCRQCQESLEQDKADDKVIITEEPDKFIFRVEGTGAIEPQMIVLQAFEILSKKLTDLLHDIGEAPVKAHE